MLSSSHIQKGNIKGPMIFHAFSSYSGFLEALWNKDSSILDLIDNSPDNTHYVFLNSEENPHKTAMWMKGRFESILEKYYTIAKSLERFDLKSCYKCGSRHDELCMMEIFIAFF